jgi:hypothetical protein
MICGKCGKTGHNKRTCGRASKTHRPKATGLPLGRQRRSSLRKCKKCGQMGHMAKTCDGVNGGCASWSYKKGVLERTCVTEYEVIIYDPKKRRREN